MRTYITCVLSLIVNFIFAQGKVVDKNTINLKFSVIGNQIWANENLNVSTFRNGDPIPEAKSNEEWHRYEKAKQPAWCYYNNDSVNSKFGKLYNLYAVIDKRGLAPKGWHIASDAEWSTLIKHTGGVEKSAFNLKAKTGWSSVHTKSGNGINASNFKALPGGSRSTEGKFSGIGVASFWWTSTLHEEGAWIISLQSGSNKIFRYRMECGLSVRVVKDDR